VGLRSTGLAAIALACGSLAAGCGVSKTVIYPFNNAKGSEISACKTQVAKEPGLSAALRSALESNCAHPNEAAVAKAASQSATGECQAALRGSPGLSAPLKSQLASICGQGGSAKSASSAAAQACQQLIKSSVPPALQKQALAKCPKP
jgi:hypothetical protein